MDDLRDRYRLPESNRQPLRSGRSEMPEPAESESKPPTRNSGDRQSPPKVSFESPLKTPTKSHKFIKVLLVFLIVSAIGAFVTLWAYPRYSSNNPFSSAIRNNVSIPLLYPQKLPAGYAIDKSSFRTTASGVVFNANNSSSRLVITQQKIPANFDFNNFYTNQLTDIKKFDTKYGRAVIGLNDQRHLGSLVTDKTWLLLTTNSQQPSISDMEIVLKNLKQY